MKHVSIILLLSGILLLAWGHCQYSGRHEAVDVRWARSAIFVIPGWSLAVCGYLGWLITRQPGKSKH